MEEKREEGLPYCVYIIGRLSGSFEAKGSMHGVWELLWLRYHTAVWLSNFQSQRCLWALGMESDNLLAWLAGLIGWEMGTRGRRLCDIWPTNGTQWT